MDVAQKARNVVRGLVQRHGPASLKKRLWDAEFARGRWNFLDATADESFHLVIESYANNGAILDLGCGPGTTSLELDPAKYRSYMGVDISDVAVGKARQKAQEMGRTDRNQYCQSDILAFVPPRKYDVILFGESIYYVPTARVAGMLNRYAEFLTDEGTFLARMFDATGRRQDILSVIENNFQVIEKRLSDRDSACVVLFKPKIATRTSHL